MRTFDKNKKSICFYSRSGQNKLYPLIALELQDKYRVSHIVQNSNEEKIVLSIDANARVYNLTEFIEKNWENEPLLSSFTLRDKEEKYKIGSIWSVFYVDRFLIRYSHDDAVRFIKLHVAFFDEILQKEKPSILVNEGVALFSSYIFLLMAKVHGCEYLGICCSNTEVMEKIYFIKNDESMNNYELNRIYAQRRVSPESLKKAEEYIEHFRKYSVKPSSVEIYKKHHGIEPKFKISFFSDILKYLFSVLFIKENRYNYELYNRKKEIYLYNLTNYFKYLRQKKYYNAPDYQKDIYYFFPLHFQPEASTLVNASYYEKQLYAVDLIAKKLPGDTVLYVKEHFAELGHREMYFFKKLCEYPNVKLIHPAEDSHELIKHSSGVIVLTSTVGWEAMFYRKPVYILGNPSYASFKYCRKIDRIDDLTREIIKAEKSRVPEKEYDKELIDYIAAYLQSQKDGCYYLCNERDIMEQRVLSPENVKKLAGYIVEEIEKNHAPD